MNHKRRRAKNARAGCLLCKPWKANGAKDKDPPSAKRRLQPEERRRLQKHVDE